MLKKLDKVAERRARLDEVILAAQEEWDNLSDDSKAAFEAADARRARELENIHFHTRGWRTRHV